VADAAPFKGASSDWLQITQSGFKDGRQYFDSGVRREIERDVRQFQGLHPSDSKYLTDAYKARSRFFRPKTRATIRKNEAVAAAAFFSNTDIVEITAWDDDHPMQQASAELNKELLQYRLKRHIPWFHVAIGGYQEAQSVGLVCAHTYWKTDKKKGIDTSAVDLVPIENMVFSPASSWFDVVNSSPYLIHMIPMFVKDVQARMRAIPGKTETGKWDKLDDSVILQGVQAYSDSIRLAREQNRADSQAASTSLTPYQLVWVYRTIADIDGTDYMWYTLGDSQLLCDGTPLVKSYWHGLRPYTIGYSVLEAHKVYPPGVARLTRELQGELNENANQRSDNVKLAMNKRYFGKRGSQLDIRSLVRGSPGSVTLMNDPEKDVKVQETKDVTQSSYEEQDRLNIDFDEIAGSNSKAARGDPNDLSNKVGGAELLTEDSNQIEGYQLRTYTETFVEPVLYQLMRLEQHYETDEAVLSMCGKKANIQQHGISEIDDNLMMQELSLSVHVGIGATSPRKQLDNLLFGFAKIKELLETPTLSQYGLDVEEMMNEIFGKLGYRTAERFFKWNNQDPAIMALNAQVQQLTTALKNKQDPPEIVAEKVALLQSQVKKTLAETFNVNVEGLFGSMQAAEVVAAVPAVAPVADTIAAAAGYEPPIPAGTSPAIQPAGSPPIPAGGPVGGASPAGGVSPPMGGGAPPSAAGPPMGPVGQSQGPAPGVSINPKGITNAKTGTVIHPGAAVGANPVGALGAGPAGGAGAGPNGGAGAAGRTSASSGLVKPGLPAGVPHNTDPLHPALPGHPDVGTHAGIEGGAPGAMPSAHASRPLAGPPPPIDNSELEHNRKKDIITHTETLKAKLAAGDPKAAKAEKYKADKEAQDKQRADDKTKADADKAKDAADKQRQADKEDADKRHKEHTELLKGVMDTQKQIADHLAKPKPKIVIKRDAKNNITSFEPQ
jgi:hypothetical protein